MVQTTKLTFLGTAAANFSPRLKTDCKDCFDQDARRASCMLIGENYLIDCGMYGMESIRIAGVDMSTPEPVHAALQLFGELLDEMEALMEE